MGARRVNDRLEPGGAAVRQDHGGRDRPNVGSAAQDVSVAAPELDYGRWPAFAPSFFPQLDVPAAVSVRDLEDRSKPARPRPPGRTRRIAAAAAIEGSVQLHHQPSGACPLLTGSGSPGPGASQHRSGLPVLALKCLAGPFDSDSHISGGGALRATQTLSAYRRRVVRL